MKVTVASLREYLLRREEAICIAVVCLFACTPVIEMLFCFFNPIDRIYPLLHYPVIVLNLVLPISIVLAVVVYATLLSRAVARRSGLLRWVTGSRAYLFFGLMVLWMLLSSIVTKTTYMWYLFDLYRNEPTKLVAAYFLVFFFCASRVKSPDKKEWIVLLAVIFSIVIGIYSTVHYWMVQLGREVSVSEHSSAVFFHYNHYGYYLAIHTMLCSGLFALSGKKTFRLVGLAGLALNTVFLSMNTTFGAWLACAVTFVFQFIVSWIVRRRVSWRTVAALGVFLAVTLLMSIKLPGPNQSASPELSQSSQISQAVQFSQDVKDVSTDPASAGKAGSNRWNVWKKTVAYIAERPIFGFGNEGVPEALEEETNNHRPHNEILQHALFYGIPAAVLYVCGVMAVFLSGYRNRATLDGASLLCLIGAFSYFISSLFGNTMFYTAPFFFLFLGMGYHRGRPDAPRPASPQGEAAGSEPSP